MNLGHNTLTPSRVINICNHTCDERESYIKKNSHNKINWIHESHSVRSYPSYMSARPRSASSVVEVTALYPLARRRNKSGALEQVMIFRSAMTWRARCVIVVHTHRIRIIIWPSIYAHELRETV